MAVSLKMEFRNMSNGAVLDSTLIGGDTAGASSKCLISRRFDYFHSPDGSISGHISKSSADQLTFWQ